MGSNLHQYSQPRKTKIIILARKEPVIKAKAKVKIFLQLRSMPPPSKSIKARIKTRKI